VNCGITGWQVRLFRWVGYADAKVKVCSNQPSFCRVPLTGTYGCHLILGNFSANDRIRSLRVVTMPAGKCVVVYRHVGYKGQWAAWRHNVPDLPDGLDYAASSLRLGC
jgi:hypothetical protein